MTVNADWDVNQYREEHESDDQWELRKAFMMKWKDEFSEERLVCLARVFTNMEFLRCQYPTDVMEEVARLSADIAKDYRDKQKTRLQRTFVSASEAASDSCSKTVQKDRVSSPTRKRKVKKCKKIVFVPQHPSNEENNTLNNENKINVSLENSENISDVEPETKKQRITNTIESDKVETEQKCEYNVKQKELMLFYANQMLEMKCLNPTLFNEKMFETEYGKFVLLILPWNDVVWNVINSCTACKLSLAQNFKDRKFTLTVNGMVITRAEGTRKQAREAAFKTAWDYFRQNAISLMLKEEWIAQKGRSISMSDLSNKNDFVTAFEDSVALKMMKLMGWKGGGLGVDSQGIAEPIKPAKMMSRSGLGHQDNDLTLLRRAGLALMKRHSNALDGDLVFSSEFSNKQRAVLHRCAEACDMDSRSYGLKEDRFLVVSNKVQPFTLVKAVTERGGDTPKYQVFIPEKLANIQ